MKNAANEKSVSDEIDAVVPEKSKGSQKAMDAELSCLIFD